MHNSKKLWRALLLVMFTAALCGSFGFPKSYNSVAAAPALQTELCSSGIPIAAWTFDGTPIKNPTIGSGLLTIGSGLNGPSTLIGPSGSSDVAINFSSWPDKFIDTDNIQFDISTANRRKVRLEFDYRAATNGPDTLLLQYSTDETGFKPFEPPVTLEKDSNWNSLMFDLSTIGELDNNPSAKFKIYAYGASKNAGTLGFDNVVLCALPLVTIDKVDPNPTNEGATIVWRSDFNGQYNIYLNASSCGDGTPVISKKYDTSPELSIDPIDGDSLVEGKNTIYVCVTDQNNVTDFAVSSIIKDVSSPSVTVSRANGQADTTNVLPINFSVVFSEAIDESTFDISDITQNGSATGITWELINSGDNKNFTLRAKAVAGAGDLTPSVDADKGSDKAKNQNLASTNTNNTVKYSPTSSTSYHSVIINEIAWSGTKASGDDEWIELYNTTNKPIDLEGWEIKSDDNSPIITLPKGATIAGKSYFLLARKAGTFFNNEAKPDFIYGDQNSKKQELLNGGEILRLRNKDKVVIDVANAYSGYGFTKWAAGTTSPNYASMERGSYLLNYPTEWVTFAGTPTVHDRSGNNFVYGTPGEANWINSNAIAITTIIADTPDPSLVNQFVSVTVTVVGGVTTPTKTVAITGANTNCTITLFNGMGSCSVKFTSAGTKTLTATYSGDSTHPASTDTEPHTVRSSFVTTPTRVPTPLPPPPLLAINEFVPRPGHDWNNDGVVNVGDEYIELLNHGVVNVNLSGYTLDDEVNVGSEPYRLPALTLRPGERYVFYGSETGLLLGDGGDGVRLLKPNGQLADAYNYTVVERPDQSFCRLPDNGGADDWNKNCYPTPGLQNSLSQEETVSVGNTTELYCPIADTLPDAFAEAECEPYGNNIWNPDFWDGTGWLGDKTLPGINSKWPVFAN